LNKTNLGETDYYSFFEFIWVIYRPTTQKIFCKISDYLLSTVFSPQMFLNYAKKFVVGGTDV